jgi:sulfur-oxidizing protein SoxY
MGDAMGSSVSRRVALKGGASVVLAFAMAGTLPRAAFAQQNDFAERLTAFTGGVEPQAGRIALDIPEIAENGAAVPMTVSVESPMRPDDHVEAVLVLADGNPNAGIATFHFSPLAGRAEVNTRIRLAQTQNVTAVARMSDGTFFMARREVKVTVGGCIG